ncbi:MAG: peptide-N4-asparagine amidase [Acidobacteriaceae bacterium]
MPVTVSPSIHARRLVVVAAVLLFIPAGMVSAQVVIVPPTPQIDSSNPITAAPPVPRPDTKPCVVQLFKNLEFADYTPNTFSYAPPSACHGPWAKVVFTADFTVTAGRQYDRTAAFYLGHANIYYGTTAEPRSTLSPSWHVERDVTDLSAIFKSSQTGEANIGNFVGVSGGVTYNGIIYANAALEFYPADWRDPAADAPDIVVPVNGTGGDAGTLNTTTDQITQVLNLPTNVERAYLDVIAQSQSNDEFWYFCVPNDQTANLESCGNTAFRETEVTIDGKPAGVAPVYPWIYTGGIDPYLWEPIPGVQTLDFKPYRVDLTPFAGVLADGSPHTIGVSVFNADSYFLATANVLVYTDHGTQRVTGGILSNTLSAAPNPVVKENIATGAGPTYTGSVSVASNRSFVISGYVNTSHGHVETTVQQNVRFLSVEEFDVNPATSSPDDQDAQQTNTVDSTTTTRNGWFVNTTEQHFSYPLDINYSFGLNANNTGYTQTTTAHQKDLVHTAKNTTGFTWFKSHLHNEVNAADTLNFDLNFNVLGNTNSKTKQIYRYKNFLGDCYSRTLQAEMQKLTSDATGQGCDSDDHDH